MKEQMMTTMMMNDELTVNAADVDHAVIARSLNVAKRFLYRKGYEILADNPDNKTIACLDLDLIVIAHVQPDERHSFTRGEFEDALIYFSSENLIPTDKAVRFDELTVDIVDVDRAVIKHHMNVAQYARVSDYMTPDILAETSTKEIKGMIDRLTHELVIRGED